MLTFTKVDEIDMFRLLYIYLFQIFRSALEHARKMNEELRMRLSKYEDVQNLKVH